MLIKLWGEEGVQEQLEGTKRNRHVYEKIAKGMQKRYSDKTAEQCRAKMKKLKLDYRKVKDKHNKTGQGRNTWKFLEQMDAVLGHRPATRPSVSIDTSANQDEEAEVDEGEEEEEEEGETSLEHNSSSATQEDSAAGSQVDLPVAQEPSSSGTAPQPVVSAPTDIKGKKRKRTKDEKIEAVMKSVVKEVVDAQHQSDTKFLELEEKRMKFEAEQRKEEREFQLRLMSMLFGNPGLHSAQGSYGSYQHFPGFHQ